MSKGAYDKRIQRKREQQKALRRRQKRQRQLRIGVSIAAALGILAALILAFTSGTEKPTAKPSPSPSAAGTPCAGPTPPKNNAKKYKALPKQVVNQSKKYQVTMETSCGTITMVLDPKVAPKAVNNFVFLAREGFYDGLTFHRVEANPQFQLVQGGDPQGNGQGGPGYSFEIEKPTPAPGSPYVRPGQGGQATYLRGVVAMANSGGTASNGSQFFIDAGDVALAPDYTVLGKTDDPSLAVLQKMIAAPLQGNTPTTPIYIIKVTVKEIPA